MSELTKDEKTTLTACLKSILPNKTDDELDPVLKLVGSMKGSPAVMEPSEEKLEETPEEVAGPLQGVPEQGEPATGGRRRRRTKRPRRKGRKSRRSARM
jgi:hypothetical protein